MKKLRDKKLKWVKNTKGQWLIDESVVESKSEATSSKEVDKVDERSVEQTALDSLAEQPKYLNGDTGKNSLHLLIDYVFKMMKLDVRKLNIPSTIRSICNANPRALLQVEYKNRHTPLAYLLAAPADYASAQYRDILNIQRASMFEFLSCGASFSYAMRFSVVKEAFSRMMLCKGKGVLNINEDAECLVMLTAIHIGQGAQRIGALSKSLPSHLTNLVARDDSLQPKDFNVCIQKMEEEKRRAAKEKTQRSSYSYYSFGFSFYSTTKTDEQEKEISLEEKVAKEKTPISANSFFDKEITALYKIYCSQENGLQSDTAVDLPSGLRIRVEYKVYCSQENSLLQSDTAIAWLSGLRTRVGDLDIFQLLENRGKLDSKAVYLVDRMLQVGMRFRD